MPQRAQIIVSGVGEDDSIEKLWGSTERQDLGTALKRLGVSLVTTPNYSLVPDRPRWEDLFSMKRIAILWYELASSGMPTALHVNARTRRDFERWGDFLCEHPEIDTIAFEFGTGAKAPERRSWYADELVELARSVPRPVSLVTRGGDKVLERLAAAFESVVYIDTNAYSKTVQAREAITYCTFAGLSTVSWPTAPGTNLTALFERNVGEMRRYVTDVLARQRACWQRTEI